LANWTIMASQRLIPTELQVANALSARPGSVHFDETGARVDAKRLWLHSTSDPLLTYFAIHEKRGAAAIENIGILPRFQGVAIHDRWGPYFQYEGCLHGLCGAHLLRDLRFIWEQYGEKWARRMRRILKRMSTAVDQAKRSGRTRFYEKTLKRFERAYHQALSTGLEFHARLEKRQGRLPSQGSRGRKKQRDGKNLLDALSRHRDSVLRFLRDFTVPFTNNQGERDIRMTKVKLKVSGCFRSLDGAQAFCRIRSYLSTGRKQGWNLLEAIRSVFLGAPMQPLLQPP
jgi:transposase